MTRAGLAALAVLFGASACASSEPVQLSSAFAPSGNYPWAFTPRGAKKPPVCRFSMGEVVDARADTTSMGNLGGRFVHHDDPVGWVRSGFASLSKDQRMQLVDAADAGDGLVLNVALLKSYMEGHATAKSANVVVRVKFTRSGEQVGEKIFRGDVTDVNWASGDGEARDSLDAALKELLVAAHDDLLARCTAKPAAAAGA